MKREVHLDYLKHLKESLATLHDIVEEARVEKPLDSSLASTFLYTKHSQELVEYVIGTCPKDFNKGDNQIASTHVTKKKRVTFMDSCETSTHNNLTHVKKQTMNKTNEPVIPSTGVKGCLKHMTGDHSWLRNFVKKFIEIVRFRNDHFGAIMGYGDYVIGDSVISREALMLCSRLGCEDLGKLQPTADIGIFFGYAPSRKGYRIYNKRTRRIMETIHIQFDELTEPMAPVRLSTGHAPMFMTPGKIKCHHVERSVSPALVVPVLVNSADTPSSTTIDQDVPCPKPHFEASSSGDVSLVESTYVTQTYYYLKKWSKDRLLDNVISNPSRLVSTRKQLATNAL
nr:integrase, catalytic region, zinc finger, CCHC-type, peptidase aspartic, catalytic [Tanacetum cinerariifolium]